MSAKVKQGEPVSGNIQSMPQEVLEEIFSYLHYAQVSAMGRECRTFREAARSILYRAIGKIMARIETEVTKIDELSKSQVETPFGEDGAFEQIHHAALITILKMCSSELRIVNVCCGRYMRDLEFDFCFPAGDLLDDFDAVVKTVQGHTGEPEKRVGSDVTTSLFIKTGKFLDFFDATLETVVAREVPLGVTLLDILGCSQASDFMLELSHAEGHSRYRLTGRYELKDTGTVDQPPDLTDYPHLVKAKVLVRYLRNYVRWNNLFDSLHKLWDLEDEPRDQNNNVADKTEDAACFFDALARERVGHRRRHISDTGDVCRDVFEGSNSTLDSPLGIAVEFNLCSRELPMSLEPLRGGHIAAKSSEAVSAKDSKDACIQTELSYVEVVSGDGEGCEDDGKATEVVDPDKVLDYVQSVKKSLNNVRNVVDQLKTPKIRPHTAGFDSDRYFRSTDSLRVETESQLYFDANADSVISFPYQCSAASINGDYSTMPKICNWIGQYDGISSHMSVVYHCSIQSLPRDTLYAPNFVLSLQNDKSVMQGSFGSLVRDCSSVKSDSITKLLSQRKNMVTVNRLGRPATVSGLMENCKLLERLSERCISLADSIGSDEHLNVGEDDDKVLEKLLHRSDERTQKTETEVEDVVVKEVPRQGQRQMESKSFLRRQEVLAEFPDNENFLMQMKIHYMADEQRIEEKTVKVNYTGSDIVIKAV